MDLFESAVKKTEGPLASRMRPRNLDEYIGQDHIVGKGRLLRRAIAADQLTSVIFYGPPGTGKTTLARVIANHTKSNFITLNAVLTGVQSIRDSIAQAEEHQKLYDRKTILFVDEVHRWNKSQQDALLPWVENGTLILVGATTENPFFEVNKALVSRSRVFQLKPLEKKDLEKAALNALADVERGYGRWQVQFEEGALNHLIETANGDARSLLNALELAVETTPEQWNPAANPCQPQEGSVIYISKETAEESIQKKVVLYDRDGDYHYDIISAFIKSLRGSDPDAAMYWLARMTAAGEDPHFIFRRMLILACEDVGLADPNALVIVQSSAAAFDQVGLPEGRYHLAHAALYLSTCPKSNSAMAFFDALSAVEKEDADVPNHLKDGSRDAEGFGHGAGYLYPHAYKDHWTAQQYLPTALTGRVFYNPSNQSYEEKIKDNVLKHRELQIAAILEESSGSEANGDYDADAHILDWWKSHHTKNGTVKKEENLTFSPGDAKRNSWQKRLDSNRALILQQIREKALSLIQIYRHSRCLISGNDDGLFIWELWRKTPEGLTCALCRTEKGKNILSQYASTLSEMDKPLFSISLDDFMEYEFDYLITKDTITSAALIEEQAADIAAKAKILAKNGTILVINKIPNKGQRISTLLAGHYGSEKLLCEKLHKAEEVFFKGKEGTDETKELFSWDETSIAAAFQNLGYSVSYTAEEFTEQRYISKQEIDLWFDSDKSQYGSFLAAKLKQDELSRIKNLLLSLTQKTIQWTTQTAFFVIRDLA